MRKIWLAAVATCALAAAACGGAGVASPSEFVTDTFTGTLDVGGGNLHNFNAVKNGELTVTVRIVTPNEPFAIVIGQGSGSNCQFVDSGNLVGQGSVLNGTVAPGPYCLGAYDAGSLTTSLTYTIDVNHP